MTCPWCVYGMRECISPILKFCGQTAWVSCGAASVLPPWNSRCKIELIFGVMLQFNVVWCIHSRREIMLTIQSDNGKQGYRVGGKKYRRPKVVLSRQPWRPIWQRLDSETRGMLSSQRAAGIHGNRPEYTHYSSRCGCGWIETWLIIDWTCQLHLPHTTLWRRKRKAC